VASCVVNRGYGLRVFFGGGRCRGGGRNQHHGSAGLRVRPLNGPSSLLLYFLRSPLSAPGRWTSVSARWATERSRPVTLMSVLCAHHPGFEPGIATM
jgi:hypothetical protein